MNLKKGVFSALCLLMLNLGLRAQNDTDPNAPNAGRGLANRVFKQVNPAENVMETVDITGTGKASFSVSNTSDGTPNSYKHNKRIVLPLQTSSKTATYQLVFYSQYESLPYSVEQTNGVTVIYFPLEMYPDLRQKLAEAGSGKKVQLKVEIRKDGYREASVF